jgi:phosphate transport system protein
LRVGCVIVGDVRNHYARQLSTRVAVLPELCALVETAMQMAHQALLDSDLQLAEQVITDDERIDQLTAEAERRLVAIIALQAPVASDLRLVISGIQITASLRRMGQLARHVAVLVRLRHPASLLPAQARDVVNDMGRCAVATAASVREALITRDLDLLRRLQTDNVEMNDLRTKLFTITLSPSWPFGIEAAVDLTLLGRFYGRFCDQAAYVASRIGWSIVPGDRAHHQPEH